MNKHQPFKTNEMERQINIENGLRVSRIIAIAAAAIVLALVGCVLFTVIWYVWEYVVLGR